MGRPRKNSETPDAKERIYQAFWELLEEYKLHEITVGMIAAKAQCNRGTFYYHFADIDDLTTKSIDREIFSNGTISRIAIRIICGEPTISKEILGAVPHITRVQILAQQGGGALIVTKFKQTILRIWEIILGVEEKDLETTTRLIIEYAISGAIGVLSYSSNNISYLEHLANDEEWVPFIRSNAHSLYQNICAAQNICPEETEARLKALVRFLELSDYSLDSVSKADVKLLRRLLSF